MGWLLEHHRELVNAEFALNEGGRTRVVRGQPLYVAVQSAEKVAHVVTVTARGPGGHAAIPLAGNAILRLGRALAVIGRHREPTQLTATTREFFSRLASVWPEPTERRAMADVTSGDHQRVVRGARVLGKTAVFDAVLRTGISATLVSGGIRTNVIPTECDREAEHPHASGSVDRCRRCSTPPSDQRFVRGCGDHGSRERIPRRPTSIRRCSLRSPTR